MGNQLSIKRKKVKKKDISSSSASQSSGSIIYNKNINQTTTTTTANTTTTEPAFSFVHFDAQKNYDNQYFLKYVFQRNCMAPVENILRKEGSQCLDVCCGDVPVWLMDMAVEYPNATFVGIDLSIDPNGIIDNNNTIRHIPKNCQFKNIDILKEIPLPPSSFDYIFQRFVYTVITIDKVGPKFKELVGLLKPGGYMELVEYDLYPKQMGPKYALLTSAFTKLASFQKSELLYHGPLIKQCLIDAGLEDIKSDYISVPICWGGNMGKIFYELLNEVLTQTGEVMWPYLDFEGEYDKNVYNEYIDVAFNECVEYKTYFNLHWATGRKPLLNSNNSDSDEIKES